MHDPDSIAESEPMEPKLFKTWSRNYLFHKYPPIYCSQFGGCQDEEKVISTFIGMVPVRYYSYCYRTVKWQYMSGAEIKDNCGAGAGVRVENK